MNKKELVKEMSLKSGLNQAQAEKALEAFKTTVMETLAKGEKVQLVGFGNFEAKDRAERIGVNPNTREEMIIPACKAPVFKAGKEFKNFIQK